VREDTYTRIALRLRDIGAEDREWLLSHLGAEDCKRVSAALQEYRAHNAARAEGAAQGLREGSKTHAETAPSKAQAGSAASKSHVESAPPPADRLAAASAADVRKLLAGQPDWAIALVLSAGPWPWSQELLGQVSPERIRALRALATELSDRVKPQFRDALIRAVVGKLAPAEIQTPVTQAFDAALQRAVHERSALDSVRLDLS
jgi:hypothetical protein